MHLLEIIPEHILRVYMDLRRPWNVWNHKKLTCLFFSASEGRLCDAEYYRTKHDIVSQIDGGEQVIMHFYLNLLLTGVLMMIYITLIRIDIDPGFF